MKMLGLRDVALTTTDERGRMGTIQFREGEEIDVPAVFAGTAKAIGYAKPLAAETDA